ncbi:MAG: DNA repair protein RecO [Geminicoccaceae bacterium]|nr:DNA repair protein RecO [Geminicoccaceae bacterium]MCX7628848.1 DNA repair protein RecO [Geminicoccaceae bacterium]MDW8124189.1 DNA repair protein RecO [Geminicoccaceae bacterium]
MEWTDEAVLLAVRPHGEHDAIASALTFEHGRHLGLVIAGRSRKRAPLLQPGNRFTLTWRARLESHLGHFTVEPQRLYAAVVVHDPLRLAALAAVTSLLDVALAEREPHPRLYAGLVAFLGRLAENAADWPETLVRFELLLLAELGFALELDRCALTGARDELVWVSPRTGRAVSRAAGAPWADRLLPLPPFLLDRAPADRKQIAQGLRLAGHFILRHLLAPADRPMPVARERLVALFDCDAENTR